MPKKTPTSIADNDLALEFGLREAKNKQSSAHHEP